MSSYIHSDNKKLQHKFIAKFQIKCRSVKATKIYHYKKTTNINTKSLIKMTIYCFNAYTRYSLIKEAGRQYSKH